MRSGKGITQVMKVPPTYWAYVRRAFAQLLEGDARAIAQMNRLLETISTVPLAQQHQPASQLFGLIGGLPAARELGFLMGRQIPLTAYGEMTLGFKIAPTLGEALKLVAKYHHREIPLFLYSYAESATEGRFTVGFRCAVDTKTEALLVSAVACIIDSELSRVTGRPCNLKKVELTPSSEGWAPSYRKHLSLTPDTHHEANTVVMDKAVLDLPNPIADRDTLDALIAEYEQQAILRSSATRPATRVRELVMSSIGDPPSLGSLSKTLHLTPRQLRLILARDGTNYQEIVKSCRVEYASTLFKDPALTISQVAYRLGYSDLSAFTHSFMRWTGKSPSRFRSDMRP